MKSMEILRFSISVALFNMKSMEILRFSICVWNEIYGDTTFFYQCCL